MLIFYRQNGPLSLTTANSILILLFILSPHLSLGRDSSSPIDSMILRPLNFIDEVSKGIGQINSNLKNSDKCVEFISDKLDKIDRLQSESFFPQSDTEKKELEEKGSQTLQALFDIQLMIQKKQKQLTQKNQLTYDCLQNVRRSTRYIRFMQDMLIEWLVERKQITHFSDSMIEAQFPQLMINPRMQQDGLCVAKPGHALKLENSSFKVGDLFLIRGKSYVSAMIARIGDTELQFSHLAILGLNHKDERVIIEALIPYGTRITPFDIWIQQKEARIVLLRYDDSAVALRAGKAAFDLANNYIIKTGHTIPYDFSMNSLTTDSLFCAEVIENAYLTSSDSKVLLPEHKTVTTKFKSTPFLKNMGIEANEIFAPGDIEFDSRFEVMAEYRFIGKYNETDEIPLLRKVRMQDAIIQSLYNWMVSDNYQFVDSWKINFKTLLAKLFRMVGFFKDRFPSHMPFSSLKTVMQFEDTGHLLEKQLFPIEATFYNQKKHSLHFQEMLKILKDYRDDECRIQKTDFNQLMSSVLCGK